MEQCLLNPPITEQKWAGFCRFHTVCTRQVSYEVPGAHRLCTYQISQVKHHEVTLTPSYHTSREKGSSGDSATWISQTAHQSVRHQVSKGASKSTTAYVVIVLSLSITYAFPQQWWATTARKLPALSPISSHTASKYRANGKSCFDAATCTRTTTGTDGQLTLTVINPSQHRC